jgi:arylsulfatase A-like enzyme
MNLLCVAIDRLHVGYLGCYGNTWVATPALDRLASTGFVFDSAIVDTLDLTAAYDTLWRGTHALERSRDLAGPTLAEVARRAGLQTLLAADDPRVLEHAAGHAFDQTLELPPFADDAATAADVDSTHAARVFADALERLEDLSSPFAMWLHLGTLDGAWDAPTEFRERYRDEEDPPVPTFTTLPERLLPADGDLDERFGFAQAYAGQVTLVDACLSGLLEHLAETGREDDTAVVVCGVRGLALGEHRAVGRNEASTHIEHVQVPLLVRLPQGRGRLRRAATIVQPCDLLPSLAELFDASLERPSGFARSWLPLIDGTAAATHDRALIVGREEPALRTARWLLRARSPQAELYVKPDDFWEVNDVADRLPHVVEGLEQCRQETTSALQEGRDPPPLPDVERLLDEA